MIVAQSAVLHDLITVHTMKLTLLLCLALTLPSAWAETMILHIGQHRIQAEIANTPQSRERGLMQRDYLCTNCGMLFVFPKAGRLSFWTKNTPLPLSIAFIAADGAILNIEEMRPNTTDTHSARGDALYALEMNKGWFAGNKIKQGNVIQGLVLLTVSQSSSLPFKGEQPPASQALHNL